MLPDQPTTPFSDGPAPFAASTTGAAGGPDRLGRDAGPATALFLKPLRRTCVPFCALLVAGVLEMAAPGHATATGLEAPHRVGGQEALIDREASALSHAQERAREPQDATTARAQLGPGDPAELEAFLDGVMAAHLPDKRIAGATISVVRNGEILVAKGYGFADWENRERVDPERTLFRIGSVTKLFTFTAVMQLAEEGRLDLDADVNQYLDFAIPATYPESITMTHLLTHTPGWEEDSRNLFTDDVEGIVPMGRWLADHQPARVRPPGAFSAYSNYGTALAGYIVERISGVSWDEYLEAHIFEPLGMALTTGRQPLPDHLEPHMSRGYAVEEGGWKAQDWEVITGAAPAGSVSSTATDMARFMIAHLQGGVLAEARILDPETARRMHSPQFVHDPRLPAFGLGFYEKSSHGVRIIGHGGNTRWFHTDLALMPDLGLGVFVSYNTAGGGELSFGPFLTAFLDHYFPTEPPPHQASDDFQDRVQGLTGSYRFNRTSYTTFQKALELAGTISVKATDDALIMGLFGPETRWVEEEPLLFREETGETRLAFRVDDSGRATHAFLSPAPMMALERVPWHGLTAVHFPILGGGLLLFLGILITAGVRSVRRWTTRSSEPIPSNLVLGRRAMTAATAMFIGFAVWAGVLISDFWALFTGPMIGLRFALALPVLGVVAAVVAGVALVRAIRAHEGSRWLRFRLGAAVTVALVFAWSLHYWNLLGWRF
jgi:CubicO group peptidase (beta-lactamase class C family)